MANINIRAPHPFQEEIKKNAKRFNVVCCGRRFGKSTMGIDLLIEPAVKPGLPVAWFAPDYKAQLEIWREVVSTLEPITKRKTEKDYRIELTTGGVVEFWALDRDPECCRGRKYARVIVDEAAKVRGLMRAWLQAIRATLVDYTGDAWFLSTPKGRNDFWDLYQKANDNESWASFQLPTSANPLLSAAEIADLREDLGREIASQEIDAEFLETGGGFFTNWSRSKHIRPINCTERECPACQNAPSKRYYCSACEGSGEYIPAPLPIPSGWTLYGGLDYGRSEQNPFAFLLFAMDYNGSLKVVDEIYEAHLSPEEQAQKVIALLKSHGRDPGVVKIYGDPSFFPKRQAMPTIVLQGGANGYKALPTPGWSMFANNGRYVSDVYQAAGLYIVPAMGANSHKERVNGWAALNQYLDKKEAFIVYEGRCPNFVRTIENIPRSPNDSLDCDTKAEDHLLDCARFFVRNHNSAPKPANQPLPASAPRWMKTALKSKQLIKL
jgi:hypothetical protein